MIRITPQMDDIRLKMASVKSLATISHHFGQYAKYQAYMAEWHDLDRQLHSLELEQRDAERQAA